MTPSRRFRRPWSLLLRRNPALGLGDGLALRLRLRTYKALEESQAHPDPDAEPVWAGQDE